MRSFTFHAVAHFDIFTLSLHDALPISLMPFLMATASARMNSAQLSRKADPSQSHEGFDLVFVSPSGVGPRPHVSVLLARPTSVRALSAPSAQSLSDP